MLIEHLRHERDHTACRDADRYVDTQGASIGFVDDVQGAEHLAAVQRVAHEIERPHGVHPRFNGQRLTFALWNASLRASRQI